MANFIQYVHFLLIVLLCMFLLLVQEYVFFWIPILIFVGLFILPRLEKTIKPLIYQILSFCLTLIVFGSLGYLVKLHGIQIYKIPSGSMTKTLLPGDIVLINKLRFGLKYKQRPRAPSYKVYQTRFSPVQRTDIIVFEYPDIKNGQKLPDNGKSIDGFNSFQ